MDPTQAKWDERYRNGALDENTASAVLIENLALLPSQGRALDLACGLGANACRLARAGLEVEAWDFSSVAINILREYADREQLGLVAQVRDVVADPPPPDSFDVIVVSHFLDRSFCPVLQQALKPKGLLLYQTFSAAATQGPRNPAFRLQENELLRLFPGLTVRVYREEGPTGATLPGEALLVAQRPG